MVKATGSCEAMEQTYNPTHSNNPQYYNLRNSSNESVNICMLDVKKSLCNKHCNSSITVLHGIVIRHAYVHACIHAYIHMGAGEGGANKSLARPTSQCRRTESIVSLERRVCSCVELQVFSCYRG